MGLLTGETEQGRERVVVFDEYGPCRMIRTKTAKLVLRLPDGPNELYDLASDPDEERNLYGDPGHAALQAELAAGLGDWFRTWVDPRFDGSRETVTGRGQLSSHAFL